MTFPVFSHILKQGFPPHWEFDLVIQWHLEAHVCFTAWTPVEITRQYMPNKKQRGLHPFFSLNNLHLPLWLWLMSFMGFSMSSDSCVRIVECKPVNFTNHAAHLLSMRGWIILFPVSRIFPLRGMWSSIVGSTYCKSEPFKINVIPFRDTHSILGVINHIIWVMWSILRWD